MLDDKHEKLWREIRVKIGPNTTPEEATKLQLQVLQFATELTWPVNQARLLERQAEVEHKRAITNAFLNAEGSDRKRDATAKSDRDARIAEVKYVEAEAYRKLLEDLRDDGKMTHYALRAVMKNNVDDKFLS